MNVLELRGVGHAFLGRTILEHIDLAVSEGELVALVGPSGCGKSTLAHVSAGLIEPRQGKVMQHYRRHAFVFQEPRLMPWATAAGNIDLALRPLGLPRRERRQRLENAARAAALDAVDLDKYPAQLSGGMRQRTAIARALAAEPDFIFFDEPFTALDAALRRRMQDLVVDAVAARGVAGLFITHDIVEAVRISHRIAVLDHQGRGVVGCRQLPLSPGERPDRMVYETAQTLLAEDPLFVHVNDVDERRVG